MSGLNPAYLCASTMAHVDEFIDGELVGRECEGIEAHLLACPDCRAAYQRELDLKRIVRNACACRGVPAELKDQVLARISQLRVEVEATAFESLKFRATATVYRESVVRRPPGDTSGGLG